MYTKLIGAICRNNADASGAYFDFIAAVILSGHGETIAFCDSVQINTFKQNAVLINIGCYLAMVNIFVGRSKGVVIKNPNKT